jgi:transposase
MATAANVNDTLVFERLFLAAFAVMARIRTVFADKGYDAEPHRELCRFFGVTPQIHTRGQPPGSGLGQRRWPVERATLGCWRTSAWPSAMTGLASSSSRSCRAHASSWLQNASPANSENRLLEHRAVFLRTHYG